MATRIFSFKTDNSDWKEISDPETGNTYWWNVLTKQTSWDKPDQLQAVEENKAVDDRPHPPSKPRLSSIKTSADDLAVAPPVSPLPSPGEPPSPSTPEDEHVISVSANKPVSAKKKVPALPSRAVSPGASPSASPPTPLRQQSAMPALGGTETGPDLTASPSPSPAAKASHHVSSASVFVTPQPRKVIPPPPKTPWPGYTTAASTSASTAASTSTPSSAASTPSASPASPARTHTAAASLSNFNLAITVTPAQSTRRAGAAGGGAGGGAATASLVTPSAPDRDQLHMVSPPMSPMSPMSPASPMSAPASPASASSTESKDDSTVGVAWVENTDTVTGRTFWLNSANGEISWTKPGGFQSPQAQRVRLNSIAYNPNAAANTSFAAAAQLEQRLFPHQPLMGQPRPSYMARQHSRQSVVGYNLEAFAANKFLLKGKGVFGKPLTPVECWQFARKLAQPLTSYINDYPKLSEAAMQVWRNITGFSGVRRSSKPKGSPAHVMKIIKQGLRTVELDMELQQFVDGFQPELLRDEIYCQLIKHVKHNPSREHSDYGWKLLSMCCATFPPSTEFHPYLSVFLQESLLEAQTAKRDAVVDFIRAAQVLLEKSVVHGPRLFCPSEGEISALMRLKPLFIRVEFVDATYKTLFVDSQTTAEDVAKMVFEKMTPLPSFGTVQCFNLSQVASELGRFLMENSLADNSRVLDVIQSWLYAQVQAEKAFAGHKESWNQKVSTLVFKFVFKARLFLRHLMARGVLSSDALGLYYIQGVYDINTGVYPTHETEAFALAGLQCICEHGDILPDVNKVSEDLRVYLSERRLRREYRLHGPDAAKMAKDKKKKKEPKQTPEYNLEIAAKILVYAQPPHVPKGLSKEEAKWRYLERLQTLPHYGCLHFNLLHVVNCKVSDWDFDANHIKKHAKSNTIKEKEPLNVVLGVSERAVLFLKPDTRSVKREDHWPQITGYGMAGEFFWYRTGDPKVDASKDDAARVMVLKTNAGSKIGELFAVYRSVPENKCVYEGTS